jgi:hypothetical protein
VAITVCKIWKIPWPESASELYRMSDRCLSARLLPTFADRRCRVVSVTDPYGRILRFLDRSRYFFLQVASQLYSRGWVDPVPDPLLLKKSGSARNLTRTSGWTMHILVPSHKWLTLTVSSSKWSWLSLVSDPQIIIIIQLTSKADFNKTSILSVGPLVHIMSHSSVQGDCLYKLRSSIKMTESCLSGNCHFLFWCPSVRAPYFWSWNVHF